MDRQRVRVRIETFGEIQNYERHVARPIARIVAQSFNYQIMPVERILPEHIEVTHQSGITLEEGVLVAITIDTEYDGQYITRQDALHERIVDTISDSGMFRCRSTQGAVRLELNLGVRLPALESA